MSGMRALSAEGDLLARVRAREEAALRQIVQDNNRRLYRIARSILKDESEAEDAVQEAYLHAFRSIDAFEQKSSLSTWLTRIVINEALGRLRKRRPTVEFSEAQDMQGRGGTVVPFPLVASAPDPERATAQSEVRRLLEAAIDALPDDFRIVLVARVVEDMSIEETAELFDLKPQTVKTRLHRARALLREDIERKFGPLFTETFPFAGTRCERMADHVIAALRTR